MPVSLSQTLKRLSWVSAGLLLLLQAVLPLAAIAAPADEHVVNDQNVQICHRTSSQGNPYTSNSVAKASILSQGHSSHTGPVFNPADYTHPSQDGWGDIIPPFDDFPGLNWTDQGHAILDNGCKYTEFIPTGSIKVNKKIDLGEGYVDDNPSQHGFVWGLNQETPARAMGSTAVDVLVGENFVTENSVEGFEFTGWFTTGSTSNSCANPEGTTLSVTVTVALDQIASVTLCNKKIEEQPPTIDYCDPSQYNIVTNVDGITAEQRAACFTVIPSQVCGEFKVDVTGPVYLLGGNPAPYRAQWVYDGEDRDARRNFPAQFTEDQNGGSVTVRYLLVGPERDFLTGTGIPNYWDNLLSAPFEITTDCEQPTDGTISLYKRVINTYGGNKQASDFELTINGEVHAQETAHELPAGKYTIGENPVDSYTLKHIKCYTQERWWTNTEKLLGGNTNGWERVDYRRYGKAKVQLAAEQHIVCIATNTDLAPQFGSISGYKFNDRNGNTLFDEDEDKLGGWTIQLWNVCDEELSIEVLARVALIQEGGCTESIIGEAVTSDEDGSYRFDNLPSGWYHVCEVQQDGWVRTFPVDSDCQTLFVNAGEEHTANFGNQAAEPGNVLGESTPVPQVLTSTGSSALMGLVAALSIIGVASGAAVPSRQKQN